MCLFSPTLVLSPSLWEKENTAAPLLPLLAGLVVSLLRTKPLPGCSSVMLEFTAHFMPRCRSIPQPVQPGWLWHPALHLCAAALAQLSQLLLTLINLIRIIDQVVCRKWEAKCLPQDPSEQWAAVAMPKVLQVLRCKGMSLLSPLASTFPFSCPSSPNPCLADWLWLIAHLITFCCAVEHNVLQRRQESQQLTAALEISNTDRRLALWDSSVASGLLTHL